MIELRNGSSSAGEPYDFLHIVRYPFGECKELDLEVYDEVIGLLPPKYIDGTIRDNGLVKCHGPTRTE